MRIVIWWFIRCCRATSLSARVVRQFIRIFAIIYHLWLYPFKPSFFSNRQGTIPPLPLYKRGTIQKVPQVGQGKKIPGDRRRGINTVRYLPYVWYICCHQQCLSSGKVFISLLRGSFGFIQPICLYSAYISWPMCLSAYVSLGLYVSQLMCLSACVSLGLYISAYICLGLCVSAYVSLGLYASRPIYLGLVCLLPLKILSVSWISGLRSAGRCPFFVSACRCCR